MWVYFWNVKETNAVYDDQPVRSLCQCQSCRQDRGEVFPYTRPLFAADFGRGLMDDDEVDDEAETIVDRMVQMFPERDDSVSTTSRMHLF